MPEHPSFRLACSGLAPRVGAVSISPPPATRASLGDALLSPASPCSRLLRQGFPQLERAAAQLRAQLPASSGLRLPPPPACTPADRRRGGTALDYRLRLALSRTPPVHALRGCADLATLPVVAQLWRELASLLEHDDPASRTRPLLLSPRREERLARICIRLGEFDAAYRTGGPSAAAHRAASSSAHLGVYLRWGIRPQLLQDLQQLTAAAEIGLAELRLCYAPDQVRAGVELSSWELVPADLDLLATDSAGALLVDVKTTAAPRAAALPLLRQLLAYVLLDTYDELGITAVGAYFARAPLLWTMGLEELATTAGARSLSELPRLRLQLREELQRRR